MLRAELKKIWQNKMLLLTVIVLLFIPILYSGFFLKGVWDPYGNMKNLPVAVVNEDQPVDYQGQTMHVGQDVVNSLKSDNSFKWDFVNAEQAKKGVEQDKYYLKITIPKDFSKNAATVMDVDPAKMDLQFETNAALNYPLESVGKTAATSIKDQVSHQVSLAYAHSIISTIKSTGNSIQQAADGAGQIKAGLGQASDGINQMQGQLPALTSGVNQLTSGSNSLNDGVKQLVNQTKASGRQVRASLPQLKQLNDGAHQLSSSLDSSLRANQGKINDITTAVNLYSQEIDGVHKLVNSQQYNNFLATLEQLQKDDKLDSFLNDEVGKGNIGKQQKQDFYNTLTTIDTKLTFAKKTPDSATLKSDLNTVITGLNAANDGAKQIADGTQQVYNQMSNMSSQLNSPSTIANLDALSNGAGHLSDGLGQLNNRLPALTNGVNQLGNGTKQLLSGSGELQNKLQTGANAVKALPLSNKTAEQIAQPVDTTHQKHSNVKNYGHGLAPYFMSVSIFVGCMMFNFAYPVRKIASQKGKWYGWFTSKVAIGAFAATAMAIILGTVMMMLGLEVDSFGLFFGYLILYANAIIFLIMFLAVAFDNPGRFVAMLILIASLGAAGGTFPIETSYPLYQVVHNFVPLAYSLTAIRSAIAGGIDASLVTQSINVTAGILIGALVCLATAMFVLTKLHGNKAGKSRLDNNQKLLSNDYSNYQMKQA